MDISIVQFRAQLEKFLIGIRGTTKKVSSISDFMAVAATSRIIATNIDDIPAENLASIFNLIEQAIVSGDEVTKSAATTGFLENLQNRSSNGSFQFERIVPFLGEASKRYCDEWDHFTGVKTPGLNTDREVDITEPVSEK